MIVEYDINWQQLETKRQSWSKPATQSHGSKTGKPVTIARPPKAGNAVQLIPQAWCSSPGLFFLL
jgi:hypothetical protein